MPTGDVFSALANPVRRRLMEALQDGPRAAGELAGQFALSRPAISEHLTVLKNARLVREEPRGRHRYYHLEAAPLAEVSEWLHPFEHYWRTRMGALRDLMDEESP
ncbi:metalloregulator ArsR/SmtB family transcription factor [Streptomyces sp. NBC_00038]|uniref:metalloregulator ArsR/SmtB family transcription factor n=1 Tax=Streptomyces sp. NBC_00038 TaxID=2903615 RepID=UPI002259143E|nr:metalloregulator ArsR/SmtB family transcription factor [Streptomyces sp. NBC_00038]MCX5562040.1 metalloregulator ArsR/SmtB family transcription factor [Streptomyces sp. NBC_00038]